MKRRDSFIFLFPPAGRGRTDSSLHVQDPRFVWSFPGFVDALLGHFLCAARFPPTKGHSPRKVGVSGGSDAYVCALLDREEGGDRGLYSVVAGT